MFCYRARILATIILVGLAAPLAKGELTAFVHPGLLHSRTALEHMKERVAEGAEPWKSGFQRLRDDRQSQANWRMRGPLAEITRDARDGENAGASTPTPTPPIRTP